MAATIYLYTILRKTLTNLAADVLGVRSRRGGNRKRKRMSAAARRNWREYPM